MAELDPIADFQDDGGTPEWRRRQAQSARVIDVSPRQNRIMTWFGGLTVWQIIGWFLIYPTVGLAAFYVGSLLLTAAAGLNVWLSMAIMAFVIGDIPFARRRKKRSGSSAIFRTRA